MFGVESVPSRDMLLLLSRHNVEKNRWTNDRVQSLRLQTVSLSMRNSPHLNVSIRIYSYLNVREGIERDVVRIYWYLSALCRFSGTHRSADIRIYPQ